jgi:hypothetical protein
MASAITSPERRSSPRMPVSRIAYLNFEGHNGGIILNVSNGGLCFHSIIPLPENGTIRFWVSERGARIEGEGRLVWMDASQNRGGLCFTNMSEEGREQVWDLATGPGARLAAVPAASVHEHAKTELPDSRRLRLPEPRPVHPSLFRTFSGGLILGIVITTGIAVVYSSHGKIGELLIRLGERLAATPKVPSQPTPPANNVIPPSVAAQVAPPSPQRGIPQSPIVPTRDAREPQNSLLILPRPLQTTSPPGPAESKPSVELTAPLLPSPSGIFDKAPTLPGAIASTPKISVLVPSTNVPDKAPGPPPPRTELRTTVEAAATPATSRVLSDQMYFEVGKFKEQLWAKEQTDKLAQLGFPASIVQKGRLWMNSFHVLVGPYPDSTEAETVHRNLLMRGFEAHPFERGSRNFILPPRLTLQGSDVPAGESSIRWESYASDVRVKFEHNYSVVATPKARWVGVNGKHGRNATVYIQNRDGSRTLVELRFEGMNRSLVFR